LPKLDRQDGETGSRGKPQALFIFDSVKLVGRIYDNKARTENRSSNSFSSRRCQNRGRESEVTAGLSRRSQYVDMASL
ncbi:hypothetical protein RvY_07398-2, partial [Ramazzottius varieornatus]